MQDTIRCNKKIDFNGRPLCLSSATFILLCHLLILKTVKFKILKTDHLLIFKKFESCISSSVVFRSHHAVSFYETIHMNTSALITMYICAVLKYHQIGSCSFSQPGNEIKYIFKCTFETCCSIIICSNSGDMVLEVFAISTNIGTRVIWTMILNFRSGFNRIWSNGICSLF